ncbi:MAG: hypothetical protein IJ697_01320 [Synergistaceae bacterium]|nr:hypothetical protein [Synergistaceae bacterium]
MLLLQNKLFTCTHISENDSKDISGFTVKKGGGWLANYIKKDALDDENDGNMRTYLVRDNYSKEIAGYFSLKAGLMSVNEKEKHSDGEDCSFIKRFLRRLFRLFSTAGQYESASSFDTLPGVELANFAVNNTYLSGHPGMKGLGMMFFSDFILPIVEDVSCSIGAKILYIFALPRDTLIDHYKTYGFMRLKKKQEKQLHRRLKNNYDESCIFMYRPISYS